MKDIFAYILFVIVIIPLVIIFTLLILLTLLIVTCIIPFYFIFCIFKKIFLSIFGGKC